MQEQAGGNTRREKAFCSSTGIRLSPGLFLHGFFRFESSQNSNSRHYPERFAPPMLPCDTVLHMNTFILQAAACTASLLLLPAAQ
ncbi:MAG: hypothetical protein RSB42_02845, partial [Comamonas sp.]